MKTKNIIMVTLIAAIALIAFTYFKKTAKPKTNASSIPGTSIVSATYIGPDRMYTGTTLKSGSQITGTINIDGSLNYTIWGSGIVASKTTIEIPGNQYVMKFE
jgi:hypothetical protein